MKFNAPQRARNLQKTNSTNSVFGKARYQIFFALVFLLLSTVVAPAAVTVDRVSSDKDSSLIGLADLRWSHTVGSGTDQALYVGVSSATRLLPASVLPSLLSVERVTYNGVPMTRVGSVQSPGLPLLGGLISKSYVDVYRLVNPPSGTHNVVVTFSTLGIIPLDVFVNQAVGGAISYNGVDQITPNGFFAANAGTGTAPNVTVNGGTSDDLIMDTLASSPNAEDFTAANDQITRWQGDFFAIPTYDLGAGSTKPGTGAPVSMNWTLEDGNGWALGGLAVRAASNPPSVLTVNTNADDESDGCAVGNCTLREAIEDAGNTPQPDTIVFAPTVTGTILLTNGQLVADSNITIIGPGARNLAVNGNNSERVFLIATPIFGGDTTVNISGLTITNGNAQPVLLGGTLIGDGGGILNGALLGIISGTSTLNLTEVNVSGNRATTLGGGIATRLGARTNVTRSLISNNAVNATLPIGVTGDVGGGGISNVASITTVSNSTVTGNRSLAAGGGILNAAGTVNLTNNTISHNRSTLAGGGVVSTAGVLLPLNLGVTNLRNTIIANNNDLLATNILGRDVVGILGSFNSLGNNLIGSNFGAQANFTANVSAGVTPTPDVNGNIIGGVTAGNVVVDPLLGSLQNNGGQTNTRLLFAGSPAIDRGNNCVLTNVCSPNPQNSNPSTALTNEQRGSGFPRLLGSFVDIGATEGTGTVAPILVNSLADNESNGCAVGDCTLREAISDANDTTIADTIVFAPGTNGTITLITGQLTISSDLTINGPGARNVTINGGGGDRVFLIATPTSGGDITVNISGLRVTNGFAQPVLIGSTVIGDGGGILNGALLGILSGTSTLNLTEMTVDNNRATTLGGGIATRLNAITNITRTTVSNNTANATLPNGVLGDVGGGGISNVASVTTITNSTISDNNSLAAGGGVLNAAGILNLTNDTIAFNRSTLAGGGVVSAAGVLLPLNLGVANVRNTIIAKNTGLLGTNLITSDVVGILGSFNSLGNNLIGSNFGAEANFTANVSAGITPTPDVNGNIVGGVTAGNVVVDPLLGDLQDNGGPTDTRLPQTGSPAIDRGNDCVLTNSCSTVLPAALVTEQRSTGYPRRQNSAVEIGAVEALAPTAAAISISGRVAQPNGKGIYRAAVTITDGSTGKVTTAMTDNRGNYRLSGIEAQRTYILEARHKEYVFASQIITPGEDLFDINFVVASSNDAVFSPF